VNEALRKWAHETIIWAGSANTNKSDRRGMTPEIIVNHIVEGSAEACISWFNDRSNKDSSAHFLVTKKGKVYQFVEIEKNAWSNGLKPEDTPKALSNIVKAKKGVNPNWYSISIEHEGTYTEAHGELTPEQLESSLLLHKFIIEYVKDSYNYTIPADREHIMPHSDIDPVRKPHCCGEKFQFDKIIGKLGGRTFLSEKVEPHWAEETIKKVQELGLMKGDELGNFDPDRACTRAELAQGLLNLYNIVPQK
jgi:N-acetyl-anhydromuramyl-L-alanine amidase AmpD